MTTNLFGTILTVKPPLLSVKSFRKEHEKFGYIEQPWDEYRGLVGYWNDDGKSAATWKDMVNYPNGNNNGTIYGATTLPAATPSALGYSFDGVDDYVNAGNHASLSPSGAITISAWIKPIELDNQAGIVSKWEDELNGRSYLMALASTNKLRGIVSSDGSSVYQVDTTVNVSMDSFQHVSMVFSPSNYLYLYINGQNQTTTSSGVLPSSVFLYTYSTIIGGWRNPIASSTAFNGSIDEVRIYNRALSAAEVNLLFQKYRGKFGV